MDEEDEFYNSAFAFGFSFLQRDASICRSLAVWSRVGLRVDAGAHAGETTRLRPLHDGQPHMSVLRLG